MSSQLGHLCEFSDYFIYDLLVLGYHRSYPSRRRACSVRVGWVTETMWWVGCGGYVVGGKMFPRIRLISAKYLVEVEAELGKNVF